MSGASAPAPACREAARALAACVEEHSPCVARSPCARRRVRARRATTARRRPPATAALHPVAVRAPAAVSWSACRATSPRRRPRAALCEVKYAACCHCRSLRVRAMKVVYTMCASERRPPCAPALAPARRRLLALPPVWPGHAHTNSRWVRARVHPRSRLRDRGGASHAPSAFLLPALSFLRRATRIGYGRHCRGVMRASPSRELARVGYDSMHFLSVNASVESVGRCRGC